MEQKFVLWFKDVDKDDVATVGGKGANLGEMTKAGFPVPQGFIVTAQAYFHFLDEAKLRGKIHDLLSSLDVSDSKALEKAATATQKLIIRSEFPKSLAREILAAYFKLDTRLTHALVAVRSSATAEDLPGASFAGQQSTFLNVQGEANLIEKIKEAWASLFTARAIFYRVQQKFDHFKVGIAVPVQKMVNSDQSGIMFTIDPVTNDKGKIVIEAILGLGEMIVQGAVTPDHYEVDKKTETITDIQVHSQEKLMRRRLPDNEIIKLNPRQGSKQKIDSQLILGLAQLGKKLERHYYFPQDSEWAIENGQIYIVQTRPVTTIQEKISIPKLVAGAKREILVSGDPASPGISSGPVKILKSAKEIHLIKTGDVLVAEQTNPDFVPAMKKAVAIVTERGGRTSHAAIVSRELGIPAVVGAAEIMRKVKDGLMVTVNGSSGEIYKGRLNLPSNGNSENLSGLTSNMSLKTATKIYVNLAEPERAAVVSKLPADGIGLLRAEFMMAGIGIHPKKILADKKQEFYIRTLAAQMGNICREFEGRPVVYRASDFRTNEYHNLKGGAQYEPAEPNPMLGFRGAARYIADPRVFEMELEAIKHVRNKMGLKNLHLMIPFVRNPRELLEVKKLTAAAGLSRSNNFKLWMMVEIPTNVIRLDDFLDVGIDGVSVGSNDLTMLILGADRDNSEVAHDFTELDPSVLWALERVAGICVKRGVTCSVCGQAPSDYPELVEKLVNWGFTSMSVNSDALGRVRETVAAAEKKLVNKK